MKKISVALSSDMLAIVRKAVELGEYASASEVVRDALLQWNARRARQADEVGDFRRMWQEGLQSGPSELLDIAGTKRRARGRLAGKHSLK